MLLLVATENENGNKPSVSSRLVFSSVRGKRQILSKCFIVVWLDFGVTVYSVALWLNNVKWFLKIYWLGYVCGIVAVDTAHSAAYFLFANFMSDGKSAFYAVQSRQARAHTDRLLIYRNAIIRCFSFVCTLCR